MQIASLGNAFLIEPKATLVSGDPRLAQAARDSFDTQDACHFRGLFEPPVLAHLLSLARDGAYEHEPVEGLGERRREVDAVIGGFLGERLSDPALMAWMGEVSGAGPLVSASGRFVEMIAGSGHALSWHNDLSDRTRRLAVIVNLTETPYDGGEFELYDNVSGRHLDFVHREAGTAMVFRVLDRLLHRVNPVTAGGPRRVFAGWFFADSDLPRAET